MDIKKTISTLVSVVAVIVVIYINIPNKLSNKVEKKEFLLCEHDTLTILIERNSPGVFHYNDCYYGFVYDILNEYGNQNGKNIKLEICNNGTIINRRLKDDNVAFALAISPFKDIDNFAITHLVDSCKYEVLGNKRGKNLKNISPKQLVEKTNTLYLRGTDNIPLFTEKASKHINDTTINHSHNMIDNINLLRQKKYDCVLCKDEEAMLYRYLFKSVVSVYKPEEYVKSHLITSKNNTTLHNDFELWYGVYSGTKRYREIFTNYYFNKYLYSFIANGYISPIFSISKYDDIFMKESDNTLFDWKFLSAICSVESKYTLDLVSHKGATGLMQIMPHIAKHMGIEESKLKDANTNISCAVELLNDNIRMLDISSMVLSNDELSILLASYNAGYGHVSDAIRLAKKNYEDTKSWPVIKKYLHRKREYKYYTQRDVVHSGCFISNETEDYVDKVMTKYSEYKEKEIRINN